MYYSNQKEGQKNNSLCYDLIQLRKRIHMTQKLKNRLQKMTFQKQLNRGTDIGEIEETKYYEELLKKRTMELLGINNENISGITRGSIRP